MTNVTVSIIINRGIVYIGSGGNRQFFRWLRLRKTVTDFLQKRAKGRFFFSAFSSTGRADFEGILSENRMSEAAMGDNHEELFVEPAENNFCFKSGSRHRQASLLLVRNNPAPPFQVPVVTFVCRVGTGD
jgi:hypothetical protein